MSGLLALLGPAGRGCARVRPRATWFLGSAAPCAPPPVFLPLLRPGPDAQLLRAARRNCHGRQEPSRITAAAGGDISGTEEKKQSKSQQLKKIFKEYGAVGVSVHVGISLVSLGMFYMVVSSGLDISAILLKLGFKESLVQSKMAAGTSTFVVAYAIHKLFAPCYSLKGLSASSVNKTSPGSCHLRQNRQPGNVPSGRSLVRVCLQKPQGLIFTQVLKGQ
uniref:DUF1279 domain-containing protein n=1 Tax=Sus scrofa TaxID=9823 RepID=A0A8D1D9Y7_PIG